MCGFCNVWVCVCVGFVMCGCVYVWVLYRVVVLTVCVLVFTVFSHCFVYVHLFSLFLLSALLPPSDNSILVNNNNNNNNNNNRH
jgi:hypothetical protein